jgi:uncharacterized membrane-anchored protein
MKRGTQLIVSGFSSMVASALLGGGYVVAITNGLVREFPEYRARIQAGEMAEATIESLRVAAILVPLTVLAVWWASRRARRTQ